MSCCETCRHWRPQSREVGECHRYPPTGRGELDAWPLTSANEDCGEHETDKPITPIGPKPGGTPVAMRVARAA